MVRVTTNKQKAVLIDLGTVRIKEYDSLNVKIERLEKIQNPSSKEITSKWRFQGYADTILNALKLIIKKELLIDKTSVNGLKTYLNKVETSNARILEVMKE